MSYQEILWMESTPAVTVVVPTKATGTAVNQADLCLPMLTRKTVTTASAMVANNWLLVPKSGQMVDMFPV